MTSAPAIAEYAGVTHRQVDHWTARGYLHAQATRAAGSRGARAYEPGEQQVAKWMALLVRHGLDPKNAAQVARDLHTNGHARLGLFHITTATPHLDDIRSTA